MKVKYKEVLSEPGTNPKQLKSFWSEVSMPSFCFKKTKDPSSFRFPKFDFFDEKKKRIKKINNKKKLPENAFIFRQFKNLASFSQNERFWETSRKTGTFEPNIIFGVPKSCISSRRKKDLGD